MSSVSYSVFALRCLGMWHCDDWVTGWKAKLYTVYTVFIFFAVYTFTFSHFIMLYAFIDDANEFADASFVLLTCIATCGKMFNVISKRFIIGKLLEMARSDPFCPQDEKETAIATESIERTRLYTLIFAILAELSCTMLTVVSINRDIPHRQVPHRAWLPYNIDSSIAYWFTYSHQTLARYMVANINIGFDCLVPGMMVITCTQLKIFKHRIGKINQTVVNTVKSCKHSSHAKYQIEFEQKLLADCVKHHCTIMRFTQTANETFAPSAFLQYCASTLILCVSTYSVSQIMALSVEFCCLTMYLIAMLIEIYIYCRYATEVTLESESVINAIYSSNWQALSITTQKSIIIIMTRLLRPIRYKTGHLILSLDSFTGLLKISYSVYNVLQQKSH